MGGRCLLGFSANNSSVLTSTTFFCPLAENTGPLASAITTEVQGEIVSRVAQTLNGFAVFLASGGNARTSATAVKVRKNEADSGVGISVPLGSTGLFTDIVNKVSIGIGDRICCAVVLGADANAIIIANASVTASTTAKHSAAFGKAVPAANATTFGAFSGSASSVTSTEANSRNYSQIAQTLSNLYTYTSSNTRSVAMTFTTRKNGAPGGQTVSVPLSTTGAVEDVTHTDSLVAGDFYGWAVSIPTGTGSSQTNVIGVLRTATSPGPIGNAVGGINSGFAITSATRSMGIMGTVGAFSGEICYNTMLMPGAASNLYGYVSTNASTTAVNLALRKNQAAANQIVSITALTTGLFQDSTHSDTFKANDTLGFLIDQATTGNVSFAGLGLLTNLYYGNSGALAIGAGMSGSNKATAKRSASFAIGARVDGTRKVTAKRQGTLSVQASVGGAAKLSVRKSAALAVHAGMSMILGRSTKLSAFFHAAAAMFGFFANELTKPAYPTELIPFGQVIKARTDILFHTLDWSQVIPPGRTIVDAGAWQQAGDVHVASESFSGLTQVIEISGGTLYTNMLIMRVITDDGEDFSRALRVVLQ